MNATVSTWWIYNVPINFTMSAIFLSFLIAFEFLNSKFLNFETRAFNESLFVLRHF